MSYLDPKQQQQSGQLLPKPVQPHDQLPLRASEEIQGNILAGFKKDHQTFIFLKFPNAESGRNWLKDLMPRIAKTKDVADFNERFSHARDQRGGDDPENLRADWVNVGLTFNGLTTLAPGVKNDLETWQGRGFPAFVTGPESRAAQLGDAGLSAPAKWLIGRDDQQVHAILTVAADERDDLIVELEKLRALATKYGLVSILEQRGNTLPGDSAGHEHFGFKDGISQPGVMGFDFQDSNSGAGHPDHPDPQVLGHLGSDIIAPGEFVLGYPRQSAEEPGSDEEGTKKDTTQPEEIRPHMEWMKDGSFQVFRRLAQDVPGFWSQVTAQVQSPTFADPPTEDVLAAKLVGRWRSGTPLDTAPDKDDRSARDPKDDNDFEFEDDELGHRCPRFAHIRKMYPRDNKTFGDERRRILRRGIPFGLPFNPGEGRGHGVDADRGLLFMAFMSDIDEQFEFLQQSWANNANFPDGNAGPDPVIGESSPAAPVILRRQGAPDQSLDFKRFVHTTGAVYAFAPSITTLGRLASGGLR